MSFDKKGHWEKVYANKQSTEVSWYQSEPEVSLKLIASTNIGHTNKIIDVGGGASILIDSLLDQGFEDLTVLDISSKALACAKKRLGKRAEKVKWIEADVTTFETTENYDLWHDRAVFHFLTNQSDRFKYVQKMSQLLNSGGHVIISTFAIDGPTQCSGLDIVQYSAEKIKMEFGKDFEYVKSVNEKHLTPGGREQKFVYFYFRKR